MRIALTALARTARFTAALTPARAAEAPRWVPLYGPGNGGATVSLRVSPHDSNRILSGGDMLSMALSTDGGERAIGLRRTLRMTWT